VNDCKLLRDLKDAAKWSKLIHEMRDNGNLMRTICYQASPTEYSVIDRFVVAPATTAIIEF
jgi:hypothetical protein